MLVYRVVLAYTLNAVFCGRRFLVAARWKRMLYIAFVLLYRTLTGGQRVFGPRLSARRVVLRFCCTAFAAVFLHAYDQMLWREAGNILSVAFCSLFFGIHAPSDVFRAEAPTRTGGNVYE